MNTTQDVDSAPSTPLAKRRVLRPDAYIPRLQVEVDLHLARCNDAPNEATRLAEHAQALGLMRAIDIIEGKL